jgi:hypothetical protein
VVTEGEHDDLDSTAAAGASSEAHENEKNAADVSTEQVDEQQSDYDLANRDTGHVSEAELRRRAQDEASE